MSIKIILKFLLISFALMSCSMSTTIDNESGKECNDSAVKNIKKSDYLWLASVQCLSFMSFKNVDRKSGLISTDWYSNSKYPKERYSVNVVVLSDKIQISSLSISLNKQSLIKDNWINVDYDKTLEYEIAASIVYQAKKNKLKTN